MVIERCSTRLRISSSGITPIDTPFIDRAMQLTSSRSPGGMGPSFAIRLTTIAALLEWQRDWAKREHYDALMGLIKQQGGAYGAGVEYAYTMVHKAPQSAKKPQVVPKKSH